MSENIKWLERSELDRAAIKNILPCNISVDIGTGIRPHDLVNAAIYICCEPYAEYVDVLKQKVEDRADKIYVVEQKTWGEALECLTGICVDTVFLIDVIEHLTKDEGEVLLRRTESIARQQIVIFTPLGFVAQHSLEGGKDAWGLSGADWQEHKSGWKPEDFDNSWEIFACKDYHEYNNIGEKLDEAFGAFWAIKTISNNAEIEEEQVCSDICNAIKNKVEKYKNDIKIKKQELEISQQELNKTQQQLISTQQALTNSMKIVNHPLVRMQVSFWRFIKKVMPR